MTQPTSDYLPTRAWLPVEFAGYDSTNAPLFRLNGGRTQHYFSMDDLKDAFMGLLPEPRDD